MSEEKKLDEDSLETVTGGMTSMDWADQAKAAVAAVFEIAANTDETDENSSTPSKGGFVYPK